ncbi:MAG: hypothetical protein QXG05_00210 [Nitrososphaerota archaeon]
MQSELIFLRSTRSLLTTKLGKLFWVSISLIFAVVSMAIGGMLAFVPAETTKFYIVSSGYPPWDYPMLWLDFSKLVLVFPLLPTILMVLISTGVGFGSAVAVVLALNSRSKSTAPVSAVGAVPMVTGLATLGACCCTTCLSTAGVAVVAAVSGVSTWDVLLNDWYLGVFQLAIVFLSLLVLERELKTSEGVCYINASKGRLIASTLLRISLLIAGITWSLAMFVEWGEISPISASPAIWYHWLFEHQLLSLFAIISAFFPYGVYARIKANTLAIRTLRVSLLVAGVTWGFWVPPSLTAIGLGGFLNELFGFLGLPSSFGAIQPDSSLGAPLIFHWLFQHILLSSFALIAALSPRRAFMALLWSAKVPIGKKQEIIHNT